MSHCHTELKTSRMIVASPFALLELFHVWIADSSFVSFLVYYDPHTLRIFDVVDTLWNTV
jgi:hypothetical protein